MGNGHLSSIPVCVGQIPLKHVKTPCLLVKPHQHLNKKSMFFPLRIQQVAASQETFRCGSTHQQEMFLSIWYYMRYVYPNTNTQICIYMSIYMFEYTCNCRRKCPHEPTSLPQDFRVPLSCHWLWRPSRPQALEAVETVDAEQDSQGNSNSGEVATR